MSRLVHQFVRGITITEMWCLDEGLLVEEKRKLSDRCLIAADGCDSLLDILDAMADGDDLDGMPAPVFD
jgi:hypothetical protein